VKFTYANGCGNPFGGQLRPAPEQPCRGRARLLHLTDMAWHDCYAPKIWLYRTGSSKTSCRRTTGGPGRCLPLLGTQAESKQQVSR
jgi:hypothetical protein